MLRKIIKNKISLIGMFVAFSTVSSVTLLTGNNYPEVKGVFDKIITNSNNEDNCHVEGSIEYSYYTEPTPENAKNNKFGLYIYAEEERFLKLADELVNSNGGDWGYVLIPYNVKDFDRAKWGRVFSQTTDKHLIPVIQLWHVDPDDYKKQTEKAAKFLNSFIWPTKTRYITAYNEPNAENMWNGDINPEVYAQILNETIDVFKEENPDFFIMNGALNSSAPNDENHMAPKTFLTKMNEEVPGIFNKLDGWASHSYPQPHFSGSPNDTGWWSIKSYASELDYLYNNVDLNKDLPVFITETGWAHAEGESYNSEYLPVEEIAEYFRIAYEDVWLPDDRVVAVMPFTVRYDPPHDHFSWVDDNNIPYAHFQEVKSMKKVKGNPAHLATESTTSIGCKDNE